MEKIFAKKVNMTQIFAESGEVFPVTVLVGTEDFGETPLVAEGDKVTVTGTSKGKGFQGVVKRHGFAGGPRTHGQKHSEREPGSIGIGGVQKVLKGMRMAGRMGGDKVTLKGVEVIKVVPETKEIFVKGAIPGRRDSLVTIKKN